MTKYSDVYFIFPALGLACHTIHRTVQVCVHTSTHITALHTFISHQSCAHLTLSNDTGGNHGTVSLRKPRSLDRYGIATRTLTPDFTSERTQHPVGHGGP